MTLTRFAGPRKSQVRVDVAWRASNSAGKVAERAVKALRVVAVLDPHTDVMT
jgi:hypothetical protein